MSPGQTQSFLRLAALITGAVFLQLAVIAQFRLFGVVPDVIPVLVVSIGLIGGSLAGATTGFVAGFLIDLMLIQTMGVSALLLTTGGYFAGRLRELRDPVHPLTAPLVGAAAAVFYAVGFGVIQFSLGEASPGIWTLVWNTLLSAIYGALLAAPAFRLARWALLPTLGRDDPMIRRRRATIASQSVLASPTIDQRSRRRRVRRGR